MGTYIFLLRNDAEGAARMLAAGRSGADEQKRRLTSLEGAEVKQYAVTGRFDAVLIAELPDDAAALAATLEATAAGQYVELLSAHDPEILDAVRDRYLDTMRDLYGEDAVASTGVASGRKPDPRAGTSRESGSSDE